MNSIVGKSTGIALLLAAGLLAALFAMGVFSAQGVFAAIVDDDPATTDVDESPTVELSDDNPGATGVTLTATFQVTVAGDALVNGILIDNIDDSTQEVVITLPDGFGEFGDGANGNAASGVVESITQGGNDVGTIPAEVTTGRAVTIDIDAVAAVAGDPGVPARGHVAANMDVTVVISGIANPSTKDDYTIQLAQAGQTDTTDVVVSIPAATAELSSQEPGAAVQITLRAIADGGGVLPNQDITVDLTFTGFGLPEFMPDSAIDITSTADTTSVVTTAATGFKGSPTNVLVTGSKITMTVPNVNAAGNDQTKAVTGAYTIKIKQSAGVTNPAAGGSKTITLEENAPDGTPKAATATIDRVIKLSATAGTRGTVTTATLKGFSNGTATVNLNSAKLDEVTIADNVGTLEIDTTSSKFLPNHDNVLTAQDAGGNSEDVDATFNISPKIELDPEETPVSKTVIAKLSDWPPLNEITEVKVGGTTLVRPAGAVSTDAEGEAEITLGIPSSVNRGTQTVKITGTDPAPADDDVSAPSATASLTIGVLALTAQPAMVVPGQQITIQGSGFVAGDSFNSVTVGGISVPLNPAVEASSAGDIVITINVPSPPSGDGIGSGEKTIEVTADGSSTSSYRVAEGSIEIPEAAITLSPENSRRGTTVNVTGSGFPSGDLVQVKYDNSGNSVTVAAGSADASGAISINFTVPSYANIGSEHEVVATSVGVFAPVTAEAVHETPGAMITLSADQIASGQQLTVSGANFPAFATVAVMEIGGVDVRPVPAPATSIDGDFESTVLVPQLELGNQTVSIRVSSTTITTFLELVTATAAAPTDPAEVFGGLGDRLVRVWYLERSTQVWSFYDPDPVNAVFNTLTEVSSGQNVSIIVNAGATIGFQGDTLYAGTNPIALD